MTAASRVLGSGLLGFAALAAARFFQVHRAYYGAPLSYLALLALGELFLLGVGFRLAFPRERCSDCRERF